MKPSNARSVVALLVALGGAIAALLVLNGCSRGAGSESDGVTTPAPISPCEEGWELALSDNLNGSGNVDANGLDVDWVRVCARSALS